MGKSQELKAALAVIVRELGGEGVEQNEGPTVAELWAPFEAAMQSELASWKTERGRAFWILRYFGDARALALTLADVDLYRAWRRSVKSTRTKRPVKPATRNREVMLLKRLLNFAVSRQLIARNPIQGAPDERENNVRRVALVERELVRLLLGADESMHEGNALMTRAFVLLTRDSGLRLGEARWVRWAYCNPGENVLFFTGRTKNGEGRLVELSDRAWRAMRAWRAWRARQPRVVASEFVFANPRTGLPYGQRRLHDLFVRAAEKARLVVNGLVPRIHDMRRTYATRSVLAGVPESTVQEALGHKTLSTTKRYNAHSPEHIKRARELNEAARLRELEEMHGPRKPPKRAESAPTAITGDGGDEAHTVGKTATGSTGRN